MPKKSDHDHEMIDLVEEKSVAPKATVVASEPTTTILDPDPTPHTRHGRKKGQGVRAVRMMAAPDVGPTFTSREAAKHCKLFPKGEEAFAQWVEVQFGIGPAALLPVADWKTYLDNFAERPIHGFRRQQAGRRQTRRRSRR